MRIVLLSVVVAIAGFTASCGGEEEFRPPVLAVPLDTAPDVSYVIPRGASDAIARGERSEVLPSPLVIEVGQVLKIVNEDTLGYDIGPFYVGAGETIVQKANAVGTFTSVCSLHPTGRIQVQMVAAGTSQRAAAATK